MGRRVDGARLAVSDDAPAAIAAGARALQGWALRGAGRLVEAADAFEASARNSTGDRAADTLWSAVLCLDEAARVGQAGGEREPDPRVRADALVDRVAAEHAGTQAAVRAHAWRVVRASTPDVADIDALLAPSVPAELAPAARKAALEGLYRRFRTTEGVDRLSAARKALAVGDAEQVDPGQDGTLELRRRLELGVAVDDRTRSAESLAAIEVRTERDADLAQSLAAELAARRTQIAALDRRASEALAAARELAPSSAWGRVAWRAAREAAARDPAATAVQRAIAARAVVQGWPDVAQVPAVETVAWANAEVALLADMEQRADGASASEGDAPGAAAALASARARDAQDVDVALADASLRWAMGDRAGADEVLRTVLVKLPTGSPAWSPPRRCK
jgi:hypothetical protein